MTEANVEYYRRRAAGGVGLIITEGCYIRGPAGPSTSVPRAYGADRHGWERLATAVHGEDAALFVQLWHLGVARGDAPELEPERPDLSPSGIDLQGRPRGRAMTDTELDEVVDAYVEAAVFAAAAGADGVELHGAHGYLLDQFLWERTNQRRDEYGGSVDRRSAFPARVVAAVRAAVDADFVIGYRFSQWKGDHYDVKLAEDPAQLLAVIGPLADAGVDVFHVSTRRHWQLAFDGERGSLAHWTRKLTGRPTIIVGSVGVERVFRHEDEAHSDVWERVAELGAQFADGEFDVVALGRALLADPEWVAKVRDGHLDAISPFGSMSDVVA